MLSSLPKRACLKSHGLLGLRVESRILNQTIDEDPEMVFDLKGFDDNPILVLLINRLHQLLHNHITHVVHVSSTLKYHFRILELWTLYFHSPHLLDT